VNGRAGGPRSVSLTEAERRALRAMERAVTANDPELARDLAGSTGPTSRRRRWVIGVAATVTGLLLVVVPGLPDGGLQVTCLVLLLLLPDTLHHLLSPG
jgi:hypothetical protein